MDSFEEKLAQTREGYVLVVDDVATTRAVHSLMLGRHFEVRNAASGQEALTLCAERLPDLVLLDAEMPGLNGFDTCRELRRQHDIPIIFATSHESLDEHLRAFDAGATDLFVKPVAADLLTRKARLAIGQWREPTALKAEREKLRAAAGQYQSSLDERRFLLQFARSSLNCIDHAQLAQNFLRASQRLGVQCCIALRHSGGEEAWSLEGEASALERSVLAQVAGMGRIVQFKKRLALNHDSVTVVVSKMPEEESDEARRIRDNLLILIEMAAALADKLKPQRLAPARQDQAGASAFEERLRKLDADIRILLQELLDGLEASFDLMATDKHQEERIYAAVREPIERILHLLDQHAPAMSQETPATSRKELSDN